jgi:hypothetical protein
MIKVVKSSLQKSINLGYMEAIQNLRRAMEIEPHFIEPKQQLQALNSYLLRLNDAINRKGAQIKDEIYRTDLGKIPNKKFKAMISLLSTKDLGDLAASKTSSENECASLTLVDFDKLDALSNPEVVVAGKVLAIIPNEEKIPYSKH